MKNFNCDDVIRYVQTGKYPQNMTRGDFIGAVQAMPDGYKESLPRMFKAEVLPRDSLSYYAPVFSNLDINALCCLALAVIIGLCRAVYDSSPFYLKSISAGAITGVSAFFGVEGYSMITLERYWQSCQDRIHDVERMIDNTVHARMTHQ